MTAVRMQRTIPAPPRRVYRAWLDPALLARWMGPGSLTVIKAEVDARPGGHFRIFEAGPDGRDVGGFDAEILEMAEDSRLVFRWGFVGPQRREGPAFDSLLTVTFDETPGGTQLTLVHERLDDLAAAMPEVAAQVGPGWNAALDNLQRMPEEQS